MNVFDVLQVACVNPVKHYNLDVGLLNVGDDADFIVLEDLEKFNVLETYINGELVAENGKSFVESGNFEVLNNFDTDFKKITDFEFNLSKKDSCY